MKNFVFLAVMLLMIMSACQKEEISPVIEPDFTAVEENASSIIEDSFSSDDVHLKISSSSILNATNANQIPSQFFKVNSMYKDSYIHIKQYSGECSWTSYILCAGAIARANGNSYTATHTKITSMKTICTNYTNSTSNPYDRPADISVIHWYCGSYNNSVINKQLKATSQTTGRFQMIKYMLAHINTYHTPFIALALDPSSGIGHYLTVWSIDWKVGGTGSTIYYTNTLLPAQSTFNGNIKSTSLTTFLDWMRDNPSANYYNCLFLWSK